MPYYVLTFWVFEEVGRGYGRSLFIEQYNMARFATFAWATLAWVFPRVKFKVTPKGAAKKRAVRLSLPQWVVLGLNFGAMPVGIALYFLASTLPLHGLITNLLWASFNGALAIAVLSFTAVRQRFTRTRYRFPVPVAGELSFADGSRSPGTIDDLSDTGLRFYGQLPQKIQVGEAVSGTLALPDGLLPFNGDVRSLLGTDGGKAPPRAVGCSLITSVEAQIRLERFLFGSDLQWRVNGLTDQVQTPLSRLLPRWVSGPPSQPLAGRRWNSAQLRVLPDAAPMAVLLSAPGNGERLVLSYTVLAQNQPLLLDVFRRTAAVRETVQLEAIEGGADGQLHVYRAVAMPMPQASVAFAAPPEAGVAVAQSAH
nr:J120 [uncultured bacterium]